MTQERRDVYEYDRLVRFFGHNLTLVFEQLARSCCMAGVNDRIS